MRIIAGNLGGRTIQSPKTYNTHPMSDKIRGALFNMLGDVTGLSVLDAFAGSGAVGLEAISRGAKSALLIELDKDAYQTIGRNIETLQVADQVQAIRGNIKGWSNTYTSQLFDVVICDPPYDAVLEQTIRKIARHVTPTGTLVVSWPISEPAPIIPGMEMLRDKTYGNATIYVYKK
jgi:16S rRNA (guanine966-N2)-methyltransferase